MTVAKPVREGVLGEGPQSTKNDVTELAAETPTQSEAPCADLWPAALENM